jgi:hypothetical protein|tara:strand:+ start:150 stop:452 length:303 start_codon:yes stop_codon:yes gene_type:complete
MSLEVRFRYTNTAYPDKTFESVQVFFLDEYCNPDTEVRKLHDQLSEDYQLTKFTVLSDDKKSVIYTVILKKEDDRERWLEERAELGDIDKNLKEEYLGTV